MRAFRICVAVAASLALIGVTAYPQPVPNTRAPGSIAIRVEGKETVLTPSVLASIPHRDYRVPADDDANDSVMVSGVTLWSLLEKVGAPSAQASGRQRAAMYVKLTGADGQTAMVALVEIDPSFSRRTLIAADKRNGVALDAVEGPWRVFIPDESRHARWIRGLVTIDVGTLK